MQEIANADRALQQQHRQAEITAALESIEKEMRNDKTLSGQQSVAAVVSNSYGNSSSSSKSKLINSSPTKIISSEKRIASYRYQFLQQLHRTFEIFPELYLDVVEDDYGGDVTNTSSKDINNLSPSSSSLSLQEQSLSRKHSSNNVEHLTNMNDNIHAASASTSTMITSCSGSSKQKEGGGNGTAPVGVPSYIDFFILNPKLYPTTQV